MKLDELGLATSEDELMYLSFINDRNGFASEPPKARVEICKFNLYEDIISDEGLFEKMAIFIDRNARDSGIRWSKKVPTGVDPYKYTYNIVYMIQRLQFEIYDRNKKFSPGVLVVSEDVLPLMYLLPDYESSTLPCSQQRIYKCGELGRSNVYASSLLEPRTITSMVVEKNICAAIGISIINNNKFSFKVLNPNLIMKMKIID